MRISESPLSDTLVNSFDHFVRDIAHRSDDDRKPIQGLIVILFMTLFGDVGYNGFQGGDESCRRRNLAETNI